MNIQISDLQGKKVSERPVAFEIIENARGTQAVKDTVVAHLAARRQGTRSAKTVGEVAGTNKKPWRQKGTGRARAGSFQSPLWPGGGVVFGPRPHDFSVKVNAKVRKLALRKAVGERLKMGDVMVVSELKLASHKTKDFLKALQGLNVFGGSLLIVASHDKNLLLASGNVPDVRIISGEDLNAYLVLWPDRIIFTEEAFQKVEARLAKKEVA
ncbi:MAG: 50S ribosomal protein L4 [Candidatus Hydrogenedentes bacterium]|nr:50S ribosomal protein L4 [Candidatus Hydrogenedentota bacterium]